MLRLRQHRKVKDAAVSDQDPPATYPDGTEFPGAVHLRTLERISHSACAAGAPRWETMAKGAVLLEALIRRPEPVDLTTELVTALGDVRRWLDSQHLESERRQYTVILSNLATYWSQSGALRRYEDSLK